MESLIKNQKSLMISSLDKNGNPKISCAPFVYMNNNLYIYISKVADHYDNIINNGNISVMIIEDEKDSDLVFVRKRVSFSCNAKLIEDNDDILDEFSKRNGEQIMSKLRNMDFNLFEITLEKGRLVKGFGQAYDVVKVNDKFELTHVVIEKNHAEKAST